MTGIMMIFALWSEWNTQNLTNYYHMHIQKDRDSAINILHVPVASKWEDKGESKCVPLVKWWNETLRDLWIGQDQFHGKGAYLRLKCSQMTSVHIIQHWPTFFLQMWIFSVQYQWDNWSNYMITAFILSWLSVIRISSKTVMFVWLCINEKKKMLAKWKTVKLHYLSFRQFGKIVKSFHLVLFLYVQIVTY